MAVGIYKQGQGYWVRVLTAVFAGALVLAGAAWAFSQAQAIRLPTPTQRIDLAAVRGDQPQPGSLVEFELTVGGVTSTIGSAVVESFSAGSAGSATMVVRSLELVETEGMTVPPGAGVRSGQSLAGSGAVLRAEVVASVPQPIFDVLYLQAGLAGGIMLAGAVVIYWLVGVRRSAVDFLIATDGEMKKVNWSTRREIQGSTVVVVVASFLLAAAIFVVDYGFGQFFKLIGVLE
ncbi:MAG: preprotein translocase subunit SecE [Phycisphaerales bacterium]